MDKRPYTTGQNVPMSISDAPIDLEELADILCQPGVGDEPITVIGIAGPTRSGKSFLMSMLVRYLHMEGWSNKDWIEDDENSLSDRLAWREGITPHTERIKTWNRIFKIPCENEGLRNVLLVDTRGLFRSDMTKEHDTKLFAKMMLLCDDLLMNIEKRLDERLLESIEILMKYASRIIEDMNICSERRPTCQNLTFLVRDWQTPHDYAFGHDGGSQYVRGYLDMTSTSEGCSVRQNIQSKVANIDGFLMPHPGVTGEGVTFSGAVKDMSPEFRKGLGELARTLFDPLRLRRKTNGRKHMTGQQLWSFMRACDNECQKRYENPSPEVACLTAQIQEFSPVCDEKGVDEAINKCKLKIDQIVQGNGEADESYMTLIQECLEKFGGDRNSQHRRRFITKCQEYYRKVAKWGELRTLQADNLSLQMVHEAWTEYKMKMKNDMGINGITDEALSSIHEINLHESEHSYEKESICDIAFDPDHAEMLRDFVEESYERLKSINNRRQGLVQLATLDDSGNHYTAQLVTNQFIEQFTDELDKYRQIYADEEQLIAQICHLQSEYFSMFDDKWKHEWPLIDSFKHDIVDVFASEHDYCMKCNARNKVVFSNIIEEYLTKAKVTYRDVMEKVMMQGYHEPANLKSHHEQCRQIVTDQMQKELGDIEDRHTADALQKLDEYIDAEFRKCSQMNGAKAKDKPAPWKGIDIKEISAKCSSAFEFLTKVIQRANAEVRKVSVTQKTIQTASKSSLLAIQSIPISLTRPQVLLGAAVAGGLAVIGYFVFKWYKNREKRRMERMTA